MNPHSQICSLTEYTMQEEGYLSLLQVTPKLANMSCQVLLWVKVSSLTLQLCYYAGRKQSYVWDT